MIKLSRIFHYELTVHIAVLQPHKCRNIHGLGYSQFARHYYGNHYCFLFLRLLRCFSSARLRLSTTGLQPVRFPHSEISGSKNICFYPKLIAAYHVLHRLWEPRHPPCALSNLLTSLWFFDETTFLLFLFYYYYFNQFQYVKELRNPVPKKYHSIPHV